MKKLSALGLGFALVASLGAGAAFAAPGPYETEVTLVADSDQLDVTVTTTIAGAITGDGSITYPTNAAIINNSVFAVHVSAITATQASPFNLVANSAYAGSSANNALWSTVKTDITGATAFDFGGNSGFVQADWNMTAASGADKDLALTFAGAIKNLNPLPTTATKAYDIVWTVTAG